MNAIDQAKTPEMATKIASLVSLFREEFLDADPDFSPWLKDAHYDKTIDPNSIDVSYHFPGIHPTCRGQCILVMIRYNGTPYLPKADVLEIEAIGFCNEQQHWRISTVGEWTFEGFITPAREAQERIYNYFRGVFHLFQNPMYGPYQFR